MFKKFLPGSFAIYLPVWFIVIHAWRAADSECGGTAFFKCALLKMAVMPEEELWKTFDTHPEG